MRKRERLFKNASVPGATASTVTVVPSNTPYFAPRRVRIVAVSESEPWEKVDLKITAVVIGGSPQMHFNTLTPGPGSMGVHPEEIDVVNWASFSTVGLARELRFTVYNPNDCKIIVCICIEGYAHAELDEEHVADKMYRMNGEDPSKNLEASTMLPEWQLLPSLEIKLEPYDQDVIDIIPAFSAYFRPYRIRYSGHDSNGKEVPFSIIEAFCGSKLLYGGGMSRDIFKIKGSQPKPRSDHEDPLVLLSRAQRMIGTLMDHGRGGFDAMYKTSPPIGPKVRLKGMLSILLGNNDGWANIEDWPIISTVGLGASLGIVAYNPWPFEIRVSATLKGDSYSTADEIEDKPQANSKEKEEGG